MKNEFVHLHVHSEYSLLDGAARIVDLVNKAKENGHKAIALTDHGAMYGVVDFYKECKKAGIKPIIGIETYVAPRDRFDKEYSAVREYSHLILIAKNQVGYRNLCELSTRAFTEGYYYKPRIDYELLCEKGEGLIVLSACLAGDIPRALMNGDYQKAKDIAMMLKKRFQDDFYLEIQDHGIQEQREIIPDMLRLSKECEIKLVATNDVHYVNKEDAEAQDALMCVQMQRFLDEEDRMKMFGEQFYLKTGEEMLQLFEFCVEAISNTVEIADKCDLDFEFGKLHLPNYDVPEGFAHHEYLVELCENGLNGKCVDYSDEYINRLKSELSMIKEMGYTDYFLIVWDLINYAKQKKIPVGPGRGSAAGSLAAYSLGITDVDPIKYGLIFERFLNPERITMPDIDIDFCYERRQEIFDYVIKKYGSDHVAQIITFGTFGAKQAIRDVGRVLRVPYGEVDKLAKTVPFDIGMTLEKALKLSSEFRKAYDIDDNARKIIDLSLKLEGIPRHASTHAAGIVIAAKPLVDYIPLQSNDDVITTQFPMGIVEELGLLKMDLLSLRTLTVINDATEEAKNSSTDFNELLLESFDDKDVFALIAKGDTDGVFQLESTGMRAFMQQLKPDHFEEIIAGISLYRPGPMDQIPTYVERKFNSDKIEYLHPKLENILKSTYGVIVYQEQVMQVARDLAGYSLGKSDLLRRAMSKKKKEVMELERESFVKGCSENKISTEISGKIYDQMVDFAQYAFNKSHAAAYAVVAYKTAWLKVYYPAEFYAALLNSFLNDNKKISIYINDAKVHKIGILPPDVNNSVAKFSVFIGRNGDEERKYVRFGLAAIKNVGYSACEKIVVERKKNGKFSDFMDFLFRCSHFLSKRMVEYLIQAGAFDCFGKKRAQLINVSSKAIDLASEERKNKEAGQFSLFDIEDGGLSAVEIEYPNCEEYHEQQKLMMEKEATGIYISSHPLDGYKDMLVELDTTSDVLSAGEKDGMKDGSRVVLGGIVSSIKRKLTRSNAQMAYVVLEDLITQVECVVFPKVLDRCRDFLMTDAIIVVKGRINTKEDEDNVVIVDDISLFENRVIDKYRSNNSWQKNIKKNISNSKTKKQFSPGLYIKINEVKLAEAIEIARKNPGDTALVFALDGKAYIDSEINMCAGNAGLVKQMYKLVGKENVKLFF